VKTIRILAVNDPAVAAYVNPKFKFIEKIEKQLSCRISVDIIDFQDYYERLMTAFETDTYDIVMIAGHLWLASFVDKGYLKAFKIQDSEAFDYSDILESIRNEMRYKEKQYLLPSFCDGHMLLYRKSIFTDGFPKKASIKNIRDKFKALKLYEQSFKPFVLKAHPSEVFLDVLPYFRANAVEPFDQNGRPTFNTENGCNAVKDYMELLSYCPKETLNYGNDEVKNAIQSNSCDIAITWGGQLGAVMDKNCIWPEDIAFSALVNPWNVTWSFGMNHKSCNTELALEVMQSLTSKELDLEVGRVCGNPTRYSSFLTDEEKYPWYPAVKEMIENYQPLSSVPTLATSIAIVTESLTKIINSQISVQEGLRVAEEGVNALFE